MFTKIVDVFLDAELLLHVRVLRGRSWVLELYMAVQILLTFERSVAVFAFNCGAAQFNCLF